MRAKKQLWTAPYPPCRTVVSWVVLHRLPEGKVSHIFPGVQIAPWRSEVWNGGVGLAPPGVLGVSHFCSGSTRLVCDRVRDVPCGMVGRSSPLFTPWLDVRSWNTLGLCYVVRPCSWVTTGCVSCFPLACGAVSPAMMPGQIPDPSLTAGALPGLGPLTGLPGTALTAEELKYADIRNIGAMISPLHFLEVKLGKRPQPVKSELDEEEERRKRRREKNKVAAARCRNKKKERTEFLQRESERLELMNAELKAQIEELKQERQQLILMLNRHRPTCIVRTDSIKTPESEANPLLEQLEKK
ncbi:jun dimerization protein 2 isoform X1 [Rhea pennata]